MFFFCRVTFIINNVDSERLWMANEVTINEHKCEYICARRIYTYDDMSVYM